MAAEHADRLVQSIDACLARLDGEGVTAQREAENRAAREEEKRVQDRLAVHGDLACEDEVQGLPTRNTGLRLEEAEELHFVMRTRVGHTDKEYPLASARASPLS